MSSAGYPPLFGVFGVFGIFGVFGEKVKFCGAWKRVARENHRVSPVALGVRCTGIFDRLLVVLMSLNTFYLEQKKTG